MPNMQSRSDQKCESDFLFSLFRAQTKGVEGKAEKAEDKQSSTGDSATRSTFCLHNAIFDKFVFFYYRKLDSKSLSTGVFDFRSVEISSPSITTTWARDDVGACLLSRFGSVLSPRQQRKKHFFAEDMRKNSSNESLFPF